MSEYEEPNDPQFIWAMIEKNLDNRGLFKGVDEQDKEDIRNEQIEVLKLWLEEVI